VSEEVNPILSPEEIAINERMEAIFMPHVRAKRSAKLAADNAANTAPEQSRARYVHYTNADAAIQIIETKRLWMRNTTSMSDYREVEHGFEMLVRFFSQESNFKQFCDVCDTCAPGKAKEAIDLFNGWWNHIRFDIYVTSVSEHDKSEDEYGRLSMWRAFGGGQPRVAMVFSVPWFSGAAAAMGMSFNPVLYIERDRSDAPIREMMDNISRERDFLREQGPEEVKNWIFSTLLSSVACVKHAGFAEEREWRGVIAPKLHPPSFLESAIESIRGVPQLVYKIPLDEKVSPAIAGLELSHVLDRVIIGPTPYPIVLADAFRRALGGAGVENVAEKVRVSDIPIRD